MVSAVVLEPRSLVPPRMIIQSKGLDLLSALLPRRYQAIGLVIGKQLNEEYITIAVQVDNTTVTYRERILRFRKMEIYDLVGIRRLADCIAKGRFTYRRP